MPKHDEIADIKKRLDRLEGKDSVIVALVLDKSGSMESMRDAAINGFNEFLTVQKKAAPNATFLYTLFDSQVRKPEATPIEAVKPLTRKTYVPSAFTALYDAVGVTINKIKRLPKASRVAICIITDGHENSSHEYSQQVVFDLVKSAEKKGWQFTFIGANIDAYAVGQAFGILPTQIFSVRGAAGMTASTDMATNSVASYTSGQSDTVSYDQKAKKKVEATN